MNLPIDFINRMKEYLGNDFSEFLSSYDNLPYKAFRINSEKACNLDLSRLGTEPVPYADNAYYTQNEDIGSSPLHHAGAYYIQEPSAMLPVKILSPEKGDKVLDLCSAPGGKSSQIASKIGHDGVLISNEINQARSRVLLGNIERLGYTNVVVTSLAPHELSKHIEGWADKVLVDAPCSGEGMFRKNPEACNEWSLKSVEACAKRQLEIIREGGKCLKCGGILVYSTCTFSKEENELLIEEFLKEEGYELLEINSEYCQRGYDQRGFTARVFPMKQKGEGHFIAKLRKLDDCHKTPQCKPFYRTLNKKEEVVLSQFAKETLKSLPNALIAGNRLFIPPSSIPLIPYGIIGCGVKIGELEQRLIPHHQLFSAKKDLFNGVLDLTLNDERTAKYIYGEEISADLPSGYGVVAVEGCALGGIKVSNGRGKNHYPKGLRKKI